MVKCPLDMGDIYTFKVFKNSFFALKAAPAQNVTAVFTESVSCLPAAQVEFFVVLLPSVEGNVASFAVG
jgi:hypothetical protein